MAIKSTRHEDEGVNSNQFRGSMMQRTDIVEKSEGNFCVFFNKPRFTDICLI